MGRKKENNREKKVNEWRTNENMKGWKRERNKEWKSKKE